MEIPVKAEVAVDNNPNLAPGKSDLPTSLLEAASALSQNLAQSEIFLRYRKAELQLKNDHKAQLLLADFSIVQQKIRSQQQPGDLSENDFQRLHALRSAINSNAVIQEEELARGYAITFLREVNQEISNLIGIDFASLTRRSGGCC